MKRAKSLSLNYRQTDVIFISMQKLARISQTQPDTSWSVSREIGLTPTEICPSGVTALIEGAKPGKVLLLRADMDALPMPEDNDLPFKTETDAATQLWT